MLERRQRNLLAAVLRRVPVVRDRTSAPLSPDEIEHVLLRHRLAAPAELDHAANRVRPLLLEALVGTEARRSGYIRGLPPGGLPHLLTAVDRAVSQPVVLRVVYGATLQMPLRALSYALPAVQTAQRIHQATGHRTRLELVLMGGVGSVINGLPRPRVDRELGLLTEVLAGLLPRVGQEDFAILHDQWEDITALDAWAEQLDEDQRVGVLEVLAGPGGGRSEQQILRYAAAHVLLHDWGIVHLEAIHGSPTPQGAVHIDVGGLLERRFHQVRLLAGTPTSAPPAALVLTRHSVPPYTPARDGDYILRDFLGGAPIPDTLPPAVRHDLRYLARHLNRARASTPDTPDRCVRRLLTPASW